MKNRWRFLGIVLAFSFASLGHGRDALFRLTLRVVDEDGRPVESAHARIGAESREEGKGVFAEGLTNADGIFSGEVETPNAMLAGYSVEKSGYYRTRLSYSAEFRPKDGKWQPWDPTITVVFKKIGNPVPMYAKRVKFKFPELNKSFGYDLVVGDWVEPYGKGKTSDFIFEAGRAVRSDRDYDGELVLRFSNRGDGILPAEKRVPDGSGLQLTALAPADGYAFDRNWRVSRRPAADGRDIVVRGSSETMNYFFRVRSVVNAQGGIVSACYGKIHGDIQFFVGTKAPTSGMAFTYLFNPDGTRNVEFDSKRNLIGAKNDRDPAFSDLGP